MGRDGRPSRRAVLAATAGAIGGLAGCPSEGSNPTATDGATGSTDGPAQSRQQSDQSPRRPESPRVRGTPSGGSTTIAMHWGYSQNSSRWCADQPLREAVALVRTEPADGVHLDTALDPDGPAWPLPFRIEYDGEVYELVGEPL